MEGSKRDMIEEIPPFLKFGSSYIDKQFKISTFKIQCPVGLRILAQLNVIVKKVGENAWTPLDVYGIETVRFYKGELPNPDLIKMCVEKAKMVALNHRDELNQEVRKNRRISFENKGKNEIWEVDGIALDSFREVDKKRKELFPFLNKVD